MKLMLGKRSLYVLIGLIATAVGVVGVWLPGIPTTGPVLLALWAFSKSSTRLERWLLRLPILRTAIREAKLYEEQRTVTMGTKIIAQVSAWTSTILLAVFLQNIVVTVLVGSLAVACTIFMVRTPLRVREVS